MRITHSLVVFAALTLPVLASASAINISTGQAAEGSNDPYYTVTLPSGPTIQAVVVTPNPGWGAQPAYNPTPGANWIGPAADSGLSSYPGGGYVYTLTFYVADPTIASLTGEFSSDNDSQAYLNGTLEPGDATTGASSYDDFATFNLSGLVVGKNTLTFDVYNGTPGTGDFDGPTGLIVSASGSGISLTPPVPEPSSIALLGTGILGVAGIARRKFLRA